MRPLAYLLIAAWLCPAMCAAPWRVEQFPIACWRGPRPAHNSLEHYRVLRECGFNVVGPTGDYTPAENRRLLELCAQSGLKAIVTDPRIGPAMVLRGDWQDLVASVVSDYGTSPALYGYHLLDEPSSMLFEPLGLISRELERRDPGRLPYINLLPTYANTRQLGTPTYTEHLERFIGTVSPRLISYDHYALLKLGGKRPDYYENMEIVRDLSRLNGIPWWYVHHSGAYSGYREPTEAELRWQVYTSLAYGAKGIAYWYYWGHPQEGDEERTGVVDPNGHPTRLYAMLKSVNRETQVLGDALLPLDCVSVYHVGDVPPGGRRIGTDAVVRLPEGAPLMAGIFSGPGHPLHALVVNRDSAEGIDTALAFLPHVVGVERVSASDGSIRALRLTDGKLGLALGPGDGALLRLDTRFDYPRPPEALNDIDFGFDGDNMEGWGGLSGLSNPRVAAGTLTMDLGPRDPHFVRTHLQIPADTYRAVRIRMRVTSGADEAQVFWTTGDETVFADTRFMNFDILPDGKWHEYEISLNDHERWSGKEIRGLRLDPSVGGAARGAKVEIDWIVGVRPD